MAYDTLSSSPGALALRRWLLGGLALLLCGGTLASCSSVLGLDNHASAVSELCTLVDRCFGAELLPDCATRVGDRLTAASGDARAAWLSDFGNKACLESCNNARLCLDTIPVCGATADGCETSEGCCGFTDNAAMCARGSCCIQDGRSCAEPAECCSGQCRDGLCGGQQCGASGEPCELATDCCSGTCGGDGKCADVPCFPGGSDCLSDSDCCSQSCILGAEEVGVCAAVECIPEFAPCQQEFNPQQLFCCDDAECIDVPGLGQICSRCGPIGSQCQSATDCCEGSVCTSEGLCEPASGCEQQGTQCLTNSQCCAGQCFNGACCEASACGHGICTTGPPLAASCTCDVNGCSDVSNTTLKDCVAEVCEKDPWCCCQWWDDMCISVVQDTCDILCPVSPNRGQPQQP